MYSTTTTHVTIKCFPDIIERHHKTVDCLTSPIDGHGVGCRVAALREEVPLGPGRLPRAGRTAVGARHRPRFPNTVHAVTLVALVTNGETYVK